MSTCSRPMSANAARLPNWQAYDSNELYLKDQIERLDLMLRLQLKKTEGDGAAAEPDLRGLVLTRKEVEGMLLEEDGTPALEEPADQPSRTEIRRQLSALEARIAAQVEQSWRRGAAPVLELLASVFELTPFEKDVLVVVLAPEVDRKYDRLYAYLQDDVTRRRPSVDLVLNLLCESFEEQIVGRSFLCRSAPLLRHQLVLFVDPGSTESTPLLSRFLKLDNQVVNYVLHQEDGDSLIPGVRRLTSETRVRDLLLAADTKRQLACLVEHYGRLLARPAAARPHLQCRLEGPYGAGKESAAAAVCHELGLSLLAVDVPRLVRENACDETVLRRILRAAQLTGAAVLLADVDRLHGRDEASAGARDAIDTVLSDTRVPVYLAARTHQATRPGEQKPAICINLPPPDYDLRKELWQRELATIEGQLSKVDLDELSRQFIFTPGQIRDAVQQAACLGVIERRDGAAIDRSLLYRGCREQCNQKIADLARKISPVYGWDDIVLAPDRLAQLRELCQQVRLHHRVFDRWGFAKKHPRGQGLSALFAGPPGTGKTMAAEILAGDLDMDLYKIDLSRVVSKYIGETEKNLGQLFAEAAQSNAILFFDEADALFGKRTEVKDSHDRYANIEINYLLQKIEEYEGMVILATNQRGHVDDAFTRRLRFHVDFPFPDEDSRLRIWDVVFPAAAPTVEGIDVAFLAGQFKLAGGNIKNVALTSAFLAAQEDQEIGMKQVMLALKREYQKMGKILTKSEFGKFFNLVRDEA